ncbi:hypothetical protein [Trichothermofontia sp.]
MTTRTDAFSRGLDYLYGLCRLALLPDLIGLVEDRGGRVPICTWIGTHIDAVNAQLDIYAQACHACFLLWEQPAFQVLATPLAPSCRVDGVCNLKTQPMTRLIDVGRVVPADWWRLVVHEYAHAYVRSLGHHAAFARSLTHLCLSLGLTSPDGWVDGDRLKAYPPYRSTPDPLAFWRGTMPDWQTQLPDAP